MELLEGASPLSLSGTDDFFFSEDFFKSLMTRVIQTWARTLFKQWLNLPGSKTDDVTTRAELKLRLCASGLCPAVQGAALCSKQNAAGYFMAPSWLRFKHPNFLLPWAIPEGLAGRNLSISNELGTTKNPNFCLKRKAHEHSNFWKLLQEWERAFIPS